MVCTGWHPVLVAGKDLLVRLVWRERRVRGLFRITLLLLGRRLLVQFIENRAFGWFQ